MPSLTRKPPGQRGPGREQRREHMERRLLDATERLMRDGASFTELSVDRLSSAAGISRASFYIYFEDKGHLLRRLARQVFSDLTDGAQRWWGVAGRRDPDDVRTAMGSIIATYRHHQAVLVALNEMAGYDTLTAETYRELLNGISQRFARVIEHGQRDGSIRPELTAPTTASALTWMVERACQQTLPNKPLDYDAELVSTLAEIVWGAIYLKPASAS